MPEPLVETKLLPPGLRVPAVDRPRLGQTLARAGSTPVTLIAAPAGFGKTTLLGNWLAQTPAGAVACVSLDEADQDAARFWAYVFAAVERAAPGSTTAAQALRQAQPDAIENALAALINELSVLPRDLFLVLDDYHLADGPGIQPGMRFLAGHLPPPMHLVISTRADPALPLARLRARGELIEVRAADLRFTGDEVGAYLNGVHGLRLGATDVAALASRTEGWAAALQLAALSLQNRPDRTGFIAGFTGNDRFVVDYLADEVLDRQPAGRRRFLLETSILDRLSGPLCDAVTGADSSARTLAGLERENLFVVLLDDQRRWYRYHHLFGDVLRAHLLAERPEAVAGLHRRASRWHDQQGDAESAVRHALAAGDIELAAGQMERAVPDLQRRRQEAVIRRWADLVPAPILRTRPVLAAGLAGGLMASNDVTGVAGRLDDLEHALDTGSPELDRATTTRLRATAAQYRAALALIAGDRPGTVRHAERALAQADPGEHLIVAAASALIGLARWGAGDLAEAHQRYTVAADHLRQAGYIADVLGCAITLAELELTRGELGAAERTFTQALGLAADDPKLRGTADMYTGRGRIALERGDLNTARAHLRAAGDLGDAAGLPQNPYRWRAAMAALRAAEGDLDAAAALAEEAERVFVADFAPVVRPLPAIRARLLAAADDITGAQAWVRDRGLRPEDELCYEREFEHVTLAHVMLAGKHRGSASLDAACALLGRVRTAAEAGSRTGTLIEVLILLARAWEARGQREQAVAGLEEALWLAEPEGWVQVFAGAGPGIEDLLRAVVRRQRQWAFPRRLLDAATTRVRPGPEAGTVLAEPISAREFDVLRLLRSDLDGPAIARELGVSLSTVRTHTQHIYTKLGVTGRRAAVRRAHQLDLFARANHHQ